MSFFLDAIKTNRDAARRLARSGAITAAAEASDRAAGGAIYLASIVEGPLSTMAAKTAAIVAAEAAAIVATEAARWHWKDCHRARRLGMM